MNGCCNSSPSDRPCFVNPFDFSSDQLSGKINTIAVALMALIVVTFVCLCVADHYGSFFDVRDWGVIVISHFATLGASCLMLFFSSSCSDNEITEVKNSSNNPIQELLDEGELILTEVNGVAEQSEYQQELVDKVEVYRTKLETVQTHIHKRIERNEESIKKNEKSLESCILF